VETDPGLTEVAFGRWEGLRSGDLVRDRVYRRFVQAPTRTVVPGGETIRGVQRRGLRAIEEARRKHPKARLLFVSHADVIRAVLCHYLKLPLAEFRRLRVDNAALTAVETDGSWTEVKFMNYVPDIATTSKKPYEGLKPRRLRRRRKV